MGKHIRRGLAGYWWLPAVANLAAPTAAEIAVGTDLTPAVAEITGFQATTEFANGATAESTFDSQVRGIRSTSDSAITFVDDNVDTALRALLADGEAGFLLFSPYDMTPDVADKVEVWPVESGGMNRQWNATGNEMATQVAGFAVTGEPAIDAVVAA